MSQLCFFTHPGSLGLVIWTAMTLILLDPQLVAGDVDYLYPDKKPFSSIYSLDYEEFQVLYLSSLLANLSLLSHDRTDVKQLISHSSYPKKWDWREKDVVSAIKNQKKCGGCWAFSVAETIESAYSMKYNTSTSGPPHLSVQEIIDCSEYNKGCLGGSACEALRWLKETSAPLVSDRSYPLTDESQMCNVADLSKRQGVYLLNSTCLKPIDDETQLVSLIYNYGPVIAAVDATTWNEYMGGIIQYHCGDQLNHAIQIVGYDLTGDVPYYIVRNSWGTDWGHDGYVYVRALGNTCGIAQSVAVVLDVSK